jgi:hypothetical protein
LSVTADNGLGSQLLMMPRFTHLSLHAMGAAIPQALLLLHALMDLLPYPKGPRGLWYEIKTSSVHCVDEVGVPNGAERPSKGVRGKKTKRQSDNDIDMTSQQDAAMVNEFAGMFGVEAAEPELQQRQKVCLHRVSANLKLTTA